MNDYVRLRVDMSPVSEDATDLLAAFLADAGYESFEPDGTGLTAFVPSRDFNPDSVREILAGFPMEADFSISSEVVEGRDWNEEWEKNYFRPIVVGDGRVAVHSTFHTDVPSADYDIVIDPRMAFGTGHHATTSMMLTHILENSPGGKRVIDMGAGTAILSILAAKMGADSVSGIEIDPMACENARDNVDLNGVSVDVVCGDSSSLEGMAPADIFLANINRNIILADLPRYAGAIKPGGLLVVSGFYRQDIPLLEAAAAARGLVPVSHADEGEWASIVFRKEE